MTLLQRICCVAFRNNNRKQEDEISPAAPRFSRTVREQSKGRRNPGPGTAVGSKKGADGVPNDGRRNESPKGWGFGGMPPLPLGAAARAAGEVRGRGQSPDQVQNPVFKSS